MTIDFDQAVDHYGVNSIKWEFMVDDHGLKHCNLTDPDLGDQSVLPMWIADMDFLAAPPIVEAVTRRVQLDGAAKGMGRGAGLDPDDAGCGHGTARNRSPFHGAGR